MSFSLLLRCKDTMVEQGDGEGTVATPLSRCNDAGEWAWFTTTRYASLRSSPHPICGIVRALGSGKGFRRRGRRRYHRCRIAYALGLSVVCDDETSSLPPLSHCKDAGEWAGVATTRYASLRSSLPPPWHCKGAVELACFFDDVAVVVTPLLVALQDGGK